MTDPKHIENSFIPKLLKVDAITIWPFIFYAESDPSDRLVVHEITHFYQVVDVGWFQFYISYLLFYLSFRLMGHDHHDAYEAIPYEVEARQNEWLGEVF